MKEKVTIMGKTYVLRQAVTTDEDAPAGEVCEGCAFDVYNQSSGVGCAAVVRGHIPICQGTLVYIEDTPEAIAEYMARRLT